MPATVLAVLRWLRRLAGPAGFIAAFWSVLAGWTTFIGWLDAHVSHAIAFELWLVPAWAAALAGALAVAFVVVTGEWRIALRRPRPLRIVFDEDDPRCVADGSYSVGVRNVDAEGKPLKSVSLRMQPHAETHIIHEQFGLDPHSDYVMDQWEALDADATNYVRIVKVDPNHKAARLRFTLEARARDARTAFATFEYDSASLPALRRV